MCETALSIVREVGDPAMEGTVLGHLGELDARARRFDDSRARFAQGETLLRDTRGQRLLAWLLAKRGQAEFLARESDAAAAYLARAEALAEEIGAGSKSELGQEIAKLRQSLTDGADTERNERPAQN